MKLTKTETDFVEPARVARLATADSEGILHNVPICPVFANGRFYVGTESSAKKVRNIRANANVALVFDDYTEAWSMLRGVLIQGQARIVSKKEFRVLRKKFYEKFLQYKNAAPLDEADSAIIEIVPKKKFSWGL